MRARLLVLAILVASAGQTFANELAPELRTLIEGFSAHRRTAIGYLRTSNLDLGAIEIERLRDRWTHDRRGLPQSIAKDRALAAALAKTDVTIRESLAAINNGDASNARSLLERAALPLKAWRRAKGIRLFSDCIAEAGSAYERLDVHRARTPDLESATIIEGVISAAAATEVALKRCDGEAPSNIRSDPEFRRLLDGMLNSLRQVPNATRQKDIATLHRLLIEQRAFERLLAFRFG